MENIEIRKMKKIKGSWVKCEVAFKTTDFGVLVVKGFRIRESHNDGETWVQEPSYQTRDGSYFRCFFMEDEKLWQELKGQLIDAYSNYIQSSSDTFEDISPGDIPF